MINSQLISCTAPRKAPRGITLIELMIAVALALILSISGLLFYSQLQSKTKLMRVEQRLQSRARVLAAHFNNITRNAGYTGCQNDEKYNTLITQAKNIGADYQQDPYYFAGYYRIPIGNNTQNFFTVTSMMNIRPSYADTIFDYYIPYLHQHSQSEYQHVLINHSNQDYTNQSILYDNNDCEPMRNNQQVDGRWLGQKNEKNLPLRYRQIFQTFAYKLGFNGTYMGQTINNPTELFTLNRYMDHKDASGGITRLETHVENFKIEIGIADEKTPDSPYIHEYINPERLRVFQDKPFVSTDEANSIDDAVPTYLIRSIKYNYTLKDPHNLAKDINVSRAIRLYNPRLLHE